MLIFRDAHKALDSVEWAWEDSTTFDTSVSDFDGIRPLFSMYIHMYKQERVAVEYIGSSVVGRDIR